MKRFILLFIALLSAIVFGDERVVFKCDFDEVVVPGSNEGSLVTGFEGSHSLLIERVDKGSESRHFEIAADQPTDRVGTLRATVKAESVSEPSNPWNGIKVMLVLETSSGARKYPQIQIPTGTFDWKEMSQTVRLPKDAKNAWLVVGLEAVTGRAWFDNLQVTVGRPIRTGRRSETRFIGHDLPRLRGVMYGPEFREGDIRDLALKWNANQIRWQLNWTPMKRAEDWAMNLDNYDQWLEISEWKNMRPSGTD